jgi:hypothetical protein
MSITFSEVHVQDRPYTGDDSIFHSVLYCSFEYQSLKKNMKSQDIAIVGILLAVGAIARFAALYAPLPPFLVPNFVIVFYCLAIMLVVPKFSQALGIGFIGGIISALISHSIFPPGNLISEPIGAVACLLVFQALKTKFSAAPFAATLVATLASGISFICIVMLLVMVAPGLLFRHSTMRACMHSSVP